MPNRAVAAALVAVLAAVLAACDGGPSDSELQTACLAEGQAGVNKAMRKEMGIAGDAFCKCVAREARARISAEGRQAMLLDMQGKAQEARKVSMKMNDAEQKAFMEGGLGVMQACLSQALGK